MEDYDERILELLNSLRKHQNDMVYSDFMTLLHLLYERAKEGCLVDEEAQIYRQQGAALAMRDLIYSLKS